MVVDFGQSLVLLGRATYFSWRAKYPNHSIFQSTNDHEIGF
jgi:dihydrofolate reductase